MHMSGIATRPIIDEVDKISDLTITKQCWYADDSAAASTLIELKKEWSHLCDIGPSYGYYPKGPSTKDVRQNLGFSNHPLPLSGRVRISKTTPLPERPRPEFSIFTHFSIITHFYFCSLKQSLLPNSCFYKV